MSFNIILSLFPKQYSITIYIALHCIRHYIESRDDLMYTEGWVEITCKYTILHKGLKHSQIRGKGVLRDDCKMVTSNGSLLSVTTTKKISSHMF